MTTYTRTGRWIGSLFLIAMLASLLGGGLIESIVSSASPDNFTAILENQTRLTIGVLLELVNALAVIGIGVLMFPILKLYMETLARGYLAIRVVEAVFCSMIVISPLSLITLSREWVDGAADAAHFQAVGALSVAERASVMGLLIPVFFSLGALLLYSGLYQSKLLPRFIPVWGFVAAILILINNLLLTFQVEIGLGGSLVLALPIITNEIFLGIWLILKGFNPSGITQEVSYA